MRSHIEVDQEKKLIDSHEMAGFSVSVGELTRLVNDGALPPTGRQVRLTSDEICGHCTNMMVNGAER